MAAPVAAFRAASVPRSLAGPVAKAVVEAVSAAVAALVAAFAQHLYRRAWRDRLRRRLLLLLHILLGGCGCGCGCGCELPTFFANNKSSSPLQLLLRLCWQRRLTHGNLRGGGPVAAQARQLNWWKPRAAHRRYRPTSPALPSQATRTLCSPPGICRHPCAALMVLPARVLPGSSRPYSFGRQPSCPGRQESPPSPVARRRSRSRLVGCGEAGGEHQAQQQRLQSRWAAARVRPDTRVCVLLFPPSLYDSGVRRVSQHLLQDRPPVLSLCEPPSINRTCFRCIRAPAVSDSPPSLVRQGRPRSRPVPPSSRRASPPPASSPSAQVRPHILDSLPDDRGLPVLYVTRQS